jgi:peroxiredoxin
VAPYDSVELDPMVARRLRVLEALVGAPRQDPLLVGAEVPDFTLTDQPGARVSLSRLRGQVVVGNFMYTSCALTQFCFRVANHFASIARRFEDRLGKT